MDALVFGFGVATVMCLAALVAGGIEGLSQWLADATAPRVEVALREVKSPKRNAKGQFTKV